MDATAAARTRHRERSGNETRRRRRRADLRRRRADLGARRADLHRRTAFFVGGDIFGGMEKHQAFLHMMSRKKDLEKSGEGTSSSKMVTHKSPSTHATTTLKASDSEKPSFASTKPPSTNAPRDDSKKKIPRDKPVPSNKKRKITGPLLSGPLDPHALNMAYELTARANICMNYAAGSTKSLLAEELDTVRQELESSKKANVELSLRLEDALKVAEDGRVKATTALTQAQDDLRKLRRSNDDLKLELQQSASQYQALVKEKDALLSDRDKLAAENLSLGDEIYNELLIDFEQGIAQCHYFFKTPLNYAGFDIMKVLVDDKLVTLSIPEITNTDAPTESPPLTDQVVTKDTLNASAARNTAA
ncbi:hypothetical protein LR48_Vigan647s001000 [Vigna angularis]|uniref:Uncharacterized protein n=1 Tax=Phaseolus angularis TaxID=3914 RepID=A0A0L9TGU4_PHAAN|nr:hypothetical protein LR48_Vigan647s001000 [Vigna angularis]